MSGIKREQLWILTILIQIKTCAKIVKTKYKKELHRKAVDEMTYID